MRCTLMSLLAGLVLAALPAAAEEAAAPGADLSRLQSLTVQYTKQYRDKAYVEATTSAKEALSLAEAIFGPDSLRQAAVDAAKLARFAPRVVDGITVRVSGILTYDFKQ